MDTLAGNHFALVLTAAGQGTVREINSRSGLLRRVRQAPQNEQPFFRSLWKVIQGHVP